MDKINVNVFSDQSYPGVSFKNVSEIEHGSTLDRKDSIIIIKNTDDAELQTIYLSDLAKYFSDVNVGSQWYLPTVSDGQLKFVWSEDISNAPQPIIIDVSSLIPLASDTTDGRMSSIDKVTLDKLAKSSLTTTDATKVIKIILTADQWDTTTKTQKIPVELNTEKCNVLDVDVTSLSEWTTNGIVVMSEDSTGITFSCEQLPLTNLTCYLTSKSVIYDDVVSAGTL